jgi:hypothetical protein
MDIMILIFNFLFIEHLTQVGDFSRLVDSGATVDHYNVLKLYFCVIDLIVEFNVRSKSGLGIEIGQLSAEIQLLSHRKTGQIATSRKNRKNLNFKIFIFFG